MLRFGPVNGVHRILTIPYLQKESYPPMQFRDLALEDDRDSQDGFDAITIVLGVDVRNDS